MHPNHLAYDVISKTPAAERKPVLAFTRRNAFEFLDVAPPRPVIGIIGQDNGRTPLGCVEIWMASLQPVGKPIVTRGGANRKGRGRHVLRRLRLGARAARSANNSSIGRLFPAKNSSWLFLIASWIFGSRISLSSWISSGVSFGTIVMVRPDTRNSTRSPGLNPALRRMLFGTVISALGLRVTAMCCFAFSLDGSGGFVKPPPRIPPPRIPKAPPAPDRYRLADKGLAWHAHFKVLCTRYGAG